MKQLILITTFLSFASCSTPRLGVFRDTVISVDKDRIFAVIYPENTYEAYEYMEQLSRNGYECNEQKTECLGENTYIYRVYDAEGQVYLIVKKK